MKFSSDKINELKQLCGEVDEIDGLSPKEYRKKEAKRKKHYKTHQLCKQIERSLSLDWMDISESEIWTDTMIASVRQDIQSPNLILSVYILPQSRFTEKEILEELKNCRSIIRSFVAGAICRKKVPDIRFQIVAWGDIQ